MWLSIVLALPLAAGPAVPEPQPASIQAPLGHVGNVVDAPPKGGMSDSDRTVDVTWEGCEARAVYLMRYLQGAARALEQLQQSLDRAPGAEKKLFGGKKAVLAEVMKQMSSSKFEPKVSCEGAPLTDGFKLELAGPPKKWCPAKADAKTGEFWFFTAGKPAAVVSIQKGGEKDVCKPRLSVVLFDKKTPRVRLHADWGGELSASVQGEKCQALEYAFDKENQVFVPTWKSCKR